MVSSTPTITGAGQASTLEKSRAKSSEARSSLEAARKRLSDLEGELTRNASQSNSDETALRSAMNEVKRLKQALKDGEKRRRKLLTGRKRAADSTAKAEVRARKAEAKYDRAVLADLIQRQKEQDRQAASAKAPANGSQATGTVPALPPATVGAEAEDLGTATDGAEAEDLGTATARETAARTTARRATRSTAPQPRTSRAPSAQGTTDG